MRTPVTLITGASGEIGHGLIARLSSDTRPVITLDISPLDPASSARVARSFVGSITDTAMLDQIAAEYDIDCIYHLAALLSARAEAVPRVAHEVNVNGTINLLELAQCQGGSRGRAVRFLYPSSIAVYGMPTLAAKMGARPAHEDEWNAPTTMYGCNKLACEHLGRYYARSYRQPAAGGDTHVDFRSLRFPGLISAETEPSGGTSDYAAGMIHAAARGQDYACFVRPGTTLPFMAMPDAIDALMHLASAPREQLTRTAYNVSAFAASAADIGREVHAAFPDAHRSWAVDPARQRIVDSWPAEVDDRAARADWGFSPRFDFQGTFTRYLLPALRSPAS